MSSYRNEKHRLKSSECRRLQRARRIAEGLCSRCGKEKERAGVQSCEKCYAAGDRNRKKRWASNIALALCMTCGGPGAVGYRLCVPCRQIRRKTFRKLKLKVISQYGRTCGRCGETRLGCLEIDHVNNDGAKQRKELGVATKANWTTAFYRYLSAINFETEYHLQVLCANCHALKHWTGDWEDEELMSTPKEVE